MENRILAALAKFIAEKNLTKWGKDEHNRFIVFVLANLDRSEWLKALDVLGLGGNCSAFGKAMTARNTSADSAFSGRLLTLKSRADTAADLVEEIMTATI